MDSTMDLAMESSSESEGEINCTTPPPETLEDAQEIEFESNLPEKSRFKYQSSYENFMGWMMEKQLSPVSEDVLLAFFKEKAEKTKPTTLWSVYSMLKTTLLAQNNINIKEYDRLAAFLKKNSKGYKSKKSRVLTANDINNFLNNAYDDRYLAAKVVLILGVNGACHCQELLDITVDDIETHGNMMLVKIPDMKTKLQRSFVISDHSYDIVKRYKELRPDDVNTQRFLLQYRNGKCFKQVMGKNNICAMPKIIAKFLNLPDPQEYTAHCYRRTAAILLASSQHAGWKLNKIAKDYYIENPIAESPAPPPGCPSPPIPAINCSRGSRNETSAPHWVEELERQRVQAAERQAAAAERQAAATERASERQAAAIEMLAVRLAAAAEQQAAALATINHQLSDIKNILRRQ